MERQLIKVAKELNVGMNTIVDYLHERGFDTDTKPNAKISDDMYDLLVKKFSDSKAEKLKADQIVIGTRPMQPRTPVTPPVQPTLERKTISITTPTTPVATTPPPVVKTEDKPPILEEKPQPEVIERPKINLQPKVVGKIDLTPKKKEEPIVAQPNSQETPKPEVKIEPKEEQTVVPPKTEPVVEQPKPVQKVEHPKQEQKPVVKHDQKSNYTHRPHQQQHHHQQQPPQPKPQPKPVEPIEEEKMSVAPELYSAEVPQLRGLKIKGKIDVDKFIEKEKGDNSGDKKKNNNKHNNNRDRNRRGGQGGNQGNNRPTGKPEDNPQGQQNTGARNNNNNSNSDAERRKRKRKKVASGSSTGNPQQQSGQQGGGTGGNSNRQGDRPRDNRTGGQGDNRGGQNRGNAPGGRRNEPAEISKSEIEAKIKETMARLNIGGKNKGQKLRRDKREKHREKEEMRQAEMDSGKLQVTEFISVSELASLLEIAPTQIITTCMSMGIFVSINQRLDAELIEVICSEFDREVEFISAEEQVGALLEDEPDDPKDLLPRAPIVTVMGHVDHGKTSLLDYIRKTDVAAGEAGGITQHIGAYEVKLADGRKVTFLDTPGHEAFTAMRARGAKITDIAIIIIAADDNIMPQTREAISHAQAAGVPMVFAINKIDKPGADPTRIKNELAQMNLLVEEWGGKYQSQDISAKQGIGISELLEKILLEAEILDLKANPNKLASGGVIEASLDKGRGYVTKLLVQAGTLRVGDALIAGEFSGKVKAMFNERGKKVDKAGPASPVLVLGLGGAPQAGENFKVMENESDAREIANKRAQIVREQSTRATKRISLDEIGRRLALGTFKELNLIIKGDVDGSVEALADSLLKLSIEKVQVNVIHKAVGGITESDVTLAWASDAIIIGFQVRPTLNAKKLAEKEGVEIKAYSIIYEAIEELKLAIEGMLEPTKEEKVTSMIEVRQVFKISKVGTVAGCYVMEGKVDRKNFLRVIRDGIVIHPVKEGQVSQLSSLKRFKEDVKEVKSGFECGLTIDNFNDLQEGDVLETYEIIEVKQKYSKA